MYLFSGFFFIHRHYKIGTINCCVIYIYTYIYNAHSLFQTKIFLIHHEVHTIQSGLACTTPELSNQKRGSARGLWNGEFHISYINITLLKELRFIYFIWVEIHISYMNTILWKLTYSRVKTFFSWSFFD